MKFWNIHLSLTETDTNRKRKV